jgi:hypothetical protein
MAKRFEERFNQLHLLFMGLNLCTVVAGLLYSGPPLDLNVIILTVLLLLIRVKFFVDDMAYFEDVESGHLPDGLSFNVGYGLGIASWIAFTFAGAAVRYIDVASVAMLLVFGISTLWIVAAMIKQGGYEEHIPWLFFNFLYGMGFILVACRHASWNHFSSHPDAYTSVVLAFIVVLFCFDLVLTRILEQRRRKGRPAS